MRKLYLQLSRRLSLDVTYALLRRSQTTMAELGSNSPCECRVIKASELLTTAHDSQFGVSEQTVSACKHNAWLAVGAFIDHELAGLSFFSTGIVSPADNRGGNHYQGIGIKLSSDACYQFKVFVLPEYRGLGINGRMIDHALIHFQSSTINTVVTTTDIANNAFHSSVQKRGFEVVGYAAEWVVFKHSFFWIPKKIRALNGEHIIFFRPNKQPV